MMSPLLPIGGAAIGSWALQALSRFPAPGFFQELMGADEKSGNSSGHASTTTESSTKVSLDLPVAVPKFTAKLQARLAAHGIDISQPFSLKDDGRGGVIVDTDHPDRMAIEELLSTDAVLAGEFQAIANAATDEHRRQSELRGDFARDFRLRVNGSTSMIMFE